MSREIFSFCITNIALFLFRINIIFLRNAEFNLSEVCILSRHLACKKSFQWDKDDSVSNIENVVSSSEAFIIDFSDNNRR